MAYVSGNAADVAALTSAIISACTSNGWTATAADVVSKGDAFIKLTSDAPNDRVVCRAGLGYATGALTDPMPQDSYLDHPLSSEAWAWPLAYEIHLHGSEVYVVTNWDTDKYSFLAFGQSKITGMTGKGVWVCGTGDVSVENGGDFYWIDGGVLNGYNAGAVNDNARTGLFMLATAISWPTPGARSLGTYIHHGFTGWNGVSNDSLVITTDACRQLTMLDNPSVNPTGQTTLVPIQPVIDRGSSKVSMVADLLYARYVRLDTLNPGDVVTFGGDKWKVYPVYKRSSAVRSPVGNTQLKHSGTYGYAIRYDGP